MKPARKIILIFILICLALGTLSACQQTASNLTDRAINNLENEVGGAAERSSQKAGDQAGGLVCGAPLTALFLPLAVLAAASSKRLGRRSSLNSSSPRQDSRDCRSDEDAHLETNDGNS